ncbi:hypothetical protein ACSBR2_010100 [Camellia fascicularis]
MLVTCGFCIFLSIGWGPYAYFRELEESHAASQATNVNSKNAQSTEAHIGCQQDERNNNAFMGISLAADSSLKAEDLESGRRNLVRLTLYQYVNRIIVVPIEA